MKKAVKAGHVDNGLVVVAGKNANGAALNHLFAHSGSQLVTPKGIR